MAILSDTIHAHNDNLLHAELRQHQPELSTPRSPVWQATLDLLRCQAIRVYPLESARIQRGYDLAARHAVAFQADGSAHVDSSIPGTSYAVNGQCPCYDAQHIAPAGRCKHRWAKTFAHRAALALTEHWEDHMIRDVGCQTTHYTDDTGTVQLGHRATADDQQARDLAAGGYVAIACGRS